MVQDMPPPGGFATINITRTMPKPLVRQGLWAALMIGLSLNGYFVVSEWRKKYRILKLEQMEHYIAAEPFLVAEAERKFLRHLRVIREEERELMKDEPGWVVGTLYGEPCYKTLPEGALPYVNVQDYIRNRTGWEFSNRVLVPDYHQ